jgi:cytochrome c553
VYPAQVASQARVTTRLMEPEHADPAVLLVPALLGILFVAAVLENVGLSFGGYLGTVLVVMLLAAGALAIPWDRRWWRRSPEELREAATRGRVSVLRQERRRARRDGTACARCHHAPVEHRRGGAAPCAHPSCPCTAFRQPGQTRN